MIKVIFRTDQYRGDHSADVNILFNVKDGETVEQLVNRIGMKNPSDTIEIKLIQEEDNPPSNGVK
jgi:hypothetical protein